MIKLPDNTPNQNTKDIKHDLPEPEEFNNTIAGINVAKEFNFDALRKMQYEWMKNFKAYPAALKTKFVHKVIISLKPEHIKLVDGLNGDKDRYIAFSAYNILVMYGRMIQRQYYVIMFPIHAFHTMLESSTLRRMEFFEGQLLEIHFVKKNKKTYEMRFCATVVQKEKSVFERTQKHFIAPRYTP